LWKLLSSERANYLKKSGCTSIEGVNDADDFVNLKKYLQAVNVSPKDQNEMFSLLSGLLHLGNIEFSPVPESTENQIRVRYINHISFSQIDFFS
jgi:myosin heavy subunit